MAVLLGLALLFVSLYLADNRVRKTAIAGLAPPAASWVAASADFPAFWQGVEETPVFSRMRAVGGYPLRPLALGIRLKTGIRPTPDRWSVWLGETLTAWRGPDGEGLCVRPGILLRTLDAVGLLGSPMDDLPTGKVWRNGYYGWRDGFLIAASTPAGLSEALTGPMAPVERPEGDTTLVVRSETDPALDVRLSARGGINVTGTLRLPEPLSMGRAHAPRAELADGELVCATASSVALLTALSKPIRDFVPRWLNLAPYLDAVAQTMPGGWESATGPVTLTVVAIDETGGTLPAPRVVLWLANGAAGVHTPDGAITMQWDGAKGWLLPWAGEAVALAVALREDGVLMATHEALVPVGLTNARRQETDHEESIAASVAWNWETIFETAERLAMERAELELIPGWNRDDIERDLVPYFHRGKAGRSGYVTLTAMEPGIYALEGRLGE